MCELSFAILEPAFLVERPIQVFGRSFEFQRSERPVAVPTQDYVFVSE